MRAGARLLVQRRVVAQAPIANIEAIVKAQEVIVRSLVVLVIAIAVMGAAKVIVYKAGVDAAIVNFR